jgi:ABC-2 type transport system permease protein
VAVLGGQALSAYAIGALQMVVLFTIGWLVFGMELANVPALIVAVGIFLLIPVGLGLFFAPSENYLLANSLLNLLVILLGAIGGALVPIFLLPAWMEALASITPHYWALQAVQDLLFRGAGLPDITLNLAVLLGFAAVLWAGALVRLRSAP